MDRLGTCFTPENDTCKTDSRPTPLYLVNPKDQSQGPQELSKEVSGNVGSETSFNILQMDSPSQDIKVPEIPSFSEFVSRKAKESRSNLSSASDNQSPSKVKVQKNAEKRMRMQ